MLKINREGKSALQWDKVVDSSNKTAFGSGSMRDSQDGKGRYDLIPTGAIHRLAQHYETGAKKYAERNWEKGQPLHQYYNSAMRHLQALRDADLSEDHAAAALWNIVAIMHHIDAMLTGKLPLELDSFGIIKKIKEYETFEQIRSYTLDSVFTFPPFNGVTMSGALPDEPILPRKDVWDNDRFKEKEHKLYRTAKLDREELG